MEREKKGILIGVVGFLLNLLLGVFKLIAGLISHSVSILTDAANNILDGISSIITIFSFKMSSKKADRGHPHGHGRAEYIASFLIGVIIISTSVQFFIESVKKIITPAVLEISLTILIILGAAILIKAVMAVFYYISSKKLRSPALKAAAFDSVCDLAVTGSVLICMIIQKHTGVKLDGIIGLFVAAFIMFSGIKVVVSTIGTLMGGRSKETEEKIIALLLSDNKVKDCHDLLLHDYGPFRTIASVHAEFDENISITKAHKIIDRVERQVKKELGVELVIHVDPIDVSSQEIIEVRSQIKRVLKHYDLVKIHELHIDFENKIVSFDIEITEDMSKIEETIKQQLKEAVYKELQDFEVIISTDYV